MTKGEDSRATSRKNEKEVNEGLVFFAKEPTSFGDLIHNIDSKPQDDQFNDVKLNSLDKALAIKEIKKMNNDAQTCNDREQSLIIGGSLDGHTLNDMKFADIGFTENSPIDLTPDTPNKVRLFERYYRVPSTKKIQIFF